MSIPLFLVLLVVCSAYALLRGGAPERAAIGLQVAAYIATLCLNRFIDQPRYATIAVATATLDVALLIGLALLAWRSTRWWPLWIAGWQAASIVAHLAKLLDPGMLPVGYAVQAQVWAYLMLPATALGAWRHWERVRRGITDSGWKAWRGDGGYAR